MRKKKKFKCKHKLLQTFHQPLHSFSSHAFVKVWHWAYKLASDVRYSPYGSPKCTKELRWEALAWNFSNNMCVCTENSWLCPKLSWRNTSLSGDCCSLLCGNSSLNHETCVCSYKPTGSFNTDHDASWALKCHRHLKNTLLHAKFLISMR